MFDKKIKTIIKIDGMKCDHCAKKIKTTLLNIENIKTVKINLSRKEAIITSKEKLDYDKIKQIIENMDYKLIDIVEK